MCCKSVGTDLSIMDIDDFTTEICQLQKMVSSLEKKLMARDKMNTEEQEKGRSIRDQLSLSSVCDTDAQDSVCDRHASRDQTSTESLASDCNAGEQQMIKMKMCSVRLVDCMKMNMKKEDTAQKKQDAQTKKFRKPVYCELCGKSCTHTGELNRHMRVHTGERPFPCLECGKSFTRSQILRDHRRIHSGFKPFACSQCEKTFTNLPNLISHQRIHLKEKPYVCSFCGKGLSRMDILKAHQKLHSGVGLYVCFECGKTFITGGTLKRHQRIHSGEKP